MLANQLAIVEVQGHSTPIDHPDAALLPMRQFERKQFRAFVFIQIERATVAKTIRINSNHGAGQRIVRNLLNCAL